MASLNDAEKTSEGTHLGGVGICGTSGYQCPEDRWVMSLELPGEVLAGDRDSGAIFSVICGH